MGFLHCKTDGLGVLIEALVLVLTDILSHFFSLKDDVPLSHSAYSTVSFYKNIIDLVSRRGTGKVHLILHSTDLTSTGDTVYPPPMLLKSMYNFDSLTIHFNSLLLTRNLIKESIYTLFYRC